MTSDPFDLDRFVKAQKGVYSRALCEIQQGAKRSHWMWFIFPQLRGLGRSPTAVKFGIASLKEAQAYLLHPILGERLRECVKALEGLDRCDATAVFGDVDAMKLRSSLTLFTLAGGGPVFEAAISRWFGAKDEQTRKLLSSDR